MKLSKLINLLQDTHGYHDDNGVDVDFVGIKWQDEHHPSAELFPIEFLDVKRTGKEKLTVKFITKPRNP